MELEAAGGLPNTHHLALAWPWGHRPCRATPELAQSPGTHAPSSFLGRELLISLSVTLWPVPDKIPQAWGREPGGQAGPGHWL